MEKLSLLDALSNIFYFTCPCFYNIIALALLSFILCIFFCLSLHPMGTSSLHDVYYFVIIPMTSLLEALNSNHILWGWFSSWKLPIMTSNPVGIDPHEDVLLTWHPPSIMLTKMSALGTGASFYHLQVQSMDICDK